MRDLEQTLIRRAAEYLESAENLRIFRGRYIRAGSGSMGHGSMGQMGHFLDGSRGSWVSAC